MLLENFVPISIVSWPLLIVKEIPYLETVEASLFAGNPVPAAAARCDRQEFFLFSFISWASDGIVKIHVYHLHEPSLLNSPI